MIARYRYLVLLLVVLASLAGGCGSESAKLEKPLVYVSIPPHAYFVEQIADTLVEVRVLLEPGASPATFDPTPLQFARLTESALYLRAGLPFERQVVDRIEEQDPELSIIDLRDGITPLKLAEHDHGDGVVHAEETDPHIWLDPRLAQLQAQRIGAALVRLLPAHTAALRENLVRFEAQLTRLDETLAVMLAPVRGKSFWVFHPAYGYLGRRYGLHQVAIENEGKEPSARELTALIDQARAEQVVALFVQPQFSRKGAEVIADAVGCEVVVADPLAHDYLDNLYHLGSQLVTTLSPDLDSVRAGGE